MEKDLALNKPQRMICSKTQPNQTKFFNPFVISLSLSLYIYIYTYNDNAILRRGNHKGIDLVSLLVLLFNERGTIFEITFIHKHMMFSIPHHDNNENSMLMATFIYQLPLSTGGSFCLTLENKI